MSDFKKQVAEMNFEEALRELQEIVRQIELGKESLDDVINQYERGEDLKKHCEAKLKEAKLRIEKITQKDNAVVTERMDSID